MEILKRRKRPPGEHVYIPELKELYRQGRITRREFMRNATLLGLSFAAASTFLTSCGDDEGEEEGQTGGAAGAIKRGGTLNCGQPITGFEHPAQWSWYEEVVCRHVIQHLAQTDENNVTHPFMLEKWEASDDLLTWTLYLRKDITWSTGEPFNADDVEFTMKEWLNPDVGSSTLGLMDYLQPTGIEKKDDHTVVLHIDSPQIAVPEHLYHYPNVMLDHRTFDGNWLTNPVGTGYFLLDEYTEERAVLKRRDGYWLNGADGKALPYLDEVIFINLGDEATAYVSALKGGQIDVYMQPQITGVQALLDDPAVTIKSIPTSQTRVLRCRVDMDPWTDINVVNAVKYCMNREKLLDLAFFGEGIVGPDTHVAPVHPEFAPMDPWPYDTDKAKALLTEAGYPDGLDVTITVGEMWPDVVSFAQILKEDAEPAGLRISINTMPGQSYWDVWTEADFAVTSWTHRPLAVMVLPLAYICDAEGVPVAWNESRWCDDEFTELLTKAQGTLDVEERRDIMADIQRIQQDRGSIGIPYWMNSWVVHVPKVIGPIAHPTQYSDYMAETWIDTEA